ncbi:MAG: MoxR family ATPase [Cellvibrionaceae bacterium]
MQKQLARVLELLDSVLLGKPQQTRLAVVCLLAKGHLLIEDLPGMGKTTLAHALALSLGLEYKRVQFTSDMLPADIIGVNIFDRENNSFQFHQGPVFTQVLLADEINRTTPKSQSALLEAMEERQVTVDTETRQLPKPFFVIATQNPQSQSGTFPLPESQLDRFLMRIQLGYPDAQAERELLTGVDPREKLAGVKPMLSLEQLFSLQGLVGKIHASDSLLDYIQRIAEYSRVTPEFPSGLSPRGSMALLRAAKAWALLDGRKHVIPEDVQAVLIPVLAHRLRPHSDYGEDSGEALVRKLMQDVDVVQ